MTNRHASIRLDDYVSESSPIHVGVPQGLPVSPVLACVYASEPLQNLLDNPIFTKGPKDQLIPVGPRAYVDDYGFLAISPSYQENFRALEIVLTRLLKDLDEIGLHIDPAKTDLMHFCWRNSINSQPTPPLQLTLYNKPYSLTPPSVGFVHWLGVFLDKKLTFKFHIEAMCNRGRTIISGLSCLSNTIRGLNVANERTLYNTCIIPVLTYACPIWYNPNKPQRSLINKLEVIQNKGLQKVLGAFRTTPNTSLNVLLYVPPIELTIRKLCEGYALRLFRLPLMSPVTQCLPKPYVPPRIHQRPKPNHLPFK